MNNPISISSGPPQNIVIQTYTPFGRFVSWTGWIGFLLCVAGLVYQYYSYRDYFDTTGGIRERFHSGNEAATSKVAIIDVSGVIMEGDGFVKRQIDRVREDMSVKAVVLRVDSPGGTVTGSDYILHHLKQLRKERDLPLVVSMGSIATSGGYYVSMAVGDEKDTIFAEPTTTTGSIGVIIPHYDISGFLNQYNIRDDSIASHPRKQMLSMTRPIPDDQREILQAYVDTSFTRFKDIVKQGRPVFRDNSQALDKLATGEIFTAEKAQEYGLVDRIGFIEEAVERAAELAGVDDQHVRVVRFRSPAKLLEVPFLSQAGASDPLGTILELSSPRAYYLSSTLPPLITSRRSTTGSW